MPLAKFAVYSPPDGPLPYLGVVILPDHTIEAMAFGTEAEALCFIEEVSAYLMKVLEDEEAKKKTSQRKQKRKAGAASIEADSFRRRSAKQR